MEEFVPAFFATAEIGDLERAVDLKVGVVLTPDPATDPADPAVQADPGGDWTLHFAHGAFSVSRERDAACELTLLLRIPDFRAALWEGRPRLIAEVVSQLREQGPAALRPPAGHEGPTNVQEIKGWSDIQGLIECVIGDPEGEDWRLGIRIGAGAIPESPQATIRLGSPQAEAIRLGELHPLEALISGQLRLEGDLGLILQLQAVAMTVAAPGGPRSRPGR